MTPDRWEEIKSLFEQAIELPAGERAARIQATNPDPEVLEETMRLLREHDAAGSEFLSKVTKDRAELLERAARVLAESMPERPARTGLVAGRYDVTRELGSGGGGIVYLAHDRALYDRPVVLKFLFTGGETQESLSRRFRQEIEALARIRHPGVVGALDVGNTPDGQVFLVMEYIEGTTLRALMNGPMGPPRTAALIEQIAEALTAAHAAGVLHRDLKPENVMLPGDGTAVKLIDFGIAKIQYSGSDQPTHTVTFVGTLSYVAPEQLLGQASERSDVYALAVIAYEMLAGRRPFEPETPFGLHELQKAGRIVPPSRARQEGQRIAAAVDRVVLRALSFDPEKRPATPKEFARELSAALALRPSRSRIWVAGACAATILGLTAWQASANHRRGICDYAGDGWWLCPGPEISTAAGAPPQTLGHLYGVTADKKGNVYLASTGKQQVYRFDTRSPSGLTLVAGTGQKGFGGDGGDARLAALSNPIAIGVDANGDLYIVDQHNARIRKVTFPDGVIRTVAGSGVIGYAGDGGPPDKAAFSSPHGIAFDREGNLYVADEGNNRVRVIRFGSNPTVTTVVGTGVDGFGGDGGNPLQAQLSAPTGLVFDRDGNLLVADQHNNRVRKVKFGATPAIRTIVGTGTAAFGGDGDHPMKAALSGPAGLAMDSAGTLYIADCENHRVRQVIFGIKPVIRTVAGNGLAGLGGDGGGAAMARLSLPTDVAVASDGNLYIADYLNDRIRRVSMPGAVSSTAIPPRTR